jgi:hypothetical protein
MRGDHRRSDKIPLISGEWRKKHWGTPKDAWEGGPLVSHGDLDQPYSHIYTVLRLLPELHAAMDKSPTPWVHLKPALEDKRLTSQAIGFTTAWYAPTKVIAALSDRYPEMKFDLHAEEEFGLFAGSFHWHNQEHFQNVLGMTH